MALSARMKNFSTFLVYISVLIFELPKAFSLQDKLTNEANQNQDPVMQSDPQFEIPSTTTLSNGYGPSEHDFSKWLSKHNRNYTSNVEFSERFQIWKTNLIRVAKHNQEAHEGKHSFTVGMNSLADLTHDEFKLQYLLKDMGLGSIGIPAVSKLGENSTETLPESWDWTQKGVITDVKNQGNCGSCWAFATVGSVEGLYNYNHQKDNTLSGACVACGPQCGRTTRKACCSFSEQEMADCTHGGNFTCDTGGDTGDAYWDLATKAKGRLSVSCAYIYISGKTGETYTCRTDVSGAVKVDTGVRGFVNVEENNEDALKSAIYNHPGVSVAIDAGSWQFQMYTGGIFDLQECGLELNHAVLLTGYGEGHDVYGPAGFSVHADGKYWTLKNSWGTDWGEQGYFHLARDGNNQCGIESDAKYPVMYEADKPDDEDADESTAVPTAADS